MNELLRKRIERHLENLSDEQGYQLLDYVEFLEGKYGTADRKPTTFERFTDGVENALRAGRLPATAIRETMHAVDSASRLMQRLAEAGRGAVDELGRSLKETEAAPPSSAGDAPPEPGAPPSDEMPRETPPAANGGSEPPA
jgi:hypothetical protein